MCHQQEATIVAALCTIILYVQHLDNSIFPRLGYSSPVLYAEDDMMELA